MGLGHSHGPGEGRHSHHASHGRPERPAPGDAHGHGEAPDRAAARARSAQNLWIAFLLNLAFSILEIFGGLWTNSVAILADALHDFGDCLTLGLALVMQRLAARAGDAKFSYGYQRFSLLAAFLNGLILALGAAWIFFEAIPRLFAPEPVYAPGMLGMAALGVLFNGAAALRLHGGSSLNERLASWHLWEDVLGWIVVLIAAAVVHFTGLFVLDPLLSIVFNLFILYNVTKLMYSVTRVFLQSVPDSVELEHIETEIRALPHVEAVHDTRLWSLDGESHVLSAHVVVNAERSADEIFAVKQSIKRMLRAHAIEHATIEIERPDENCESPSHPIH